MEENKILEYAISTNKAVKYSNGSIVIYPKRFTSSLLLEALLQTLDHNYKLYKVMGGAIKAIPK